MVDLTLFTISASVAGYVIVQNLRGRGIGVIGLFISALIALNTMGLTPGWALDANLLLGIVFTLVYWAAVFYKSSSFFMGGTKIAVKDKPVSFFIWPRFFNWASQGRFTAYVRARGFFCKAVCATMKRNGEEELWSGVVKFQYEVADGYCQFVAGTDVVDCLDVVLVELEAYLEEDPVTWQGSQELSSGTFEGALVAWLYRFNQKKKGRMWVKTFDVSHVQKGFSQRIERSYLPWL